jgi:hypothetical protein
MNIARGKRKSICPQVTLMDADKEFLEQEATETEMETPLSAFPGGNPPGNARPHETGPATDATMASAKTRTNTV